MLRPSLAFLRQQFQLTADELADTPWCEVVRFLDVGLVIGGSDG